MSWLKGDLTRIQVDNATGVAYINNLLGNRNCRSQREASLILAWAELYFLALTTMYIPSMENRQVDFLSHQCLDSGERSLYPEVF